MTNGVIGYYDGVAVQYEGRLDNLFFKVYDLVTWKSLQPFLLKNRTGRVLDVAGGTGRWSRRIAAEGPSVVLLDLSRKMLHEADRKVRREGLQSRLTLLRGAAEQLPFHNNLFDVVLCEHSLHVIENVEGALLEMSRVAKPGGIVVVTAQGKYHKALLALRQDTNVAVETLQGRTPGFERNWLSPNECRSLVRKCGLVVEKILGKGFCNLTVPESKLFSRVYSTKDVEGLAQFEEIMSERPDALGLASHIQIVARKPVVPKIG